jgi:O-acetylhomoserine/O-acetylserine sulfhydrylase-like pyridoxal-dependent enzyme
MGNPTNSVFENRMAMLEHGVGAVATASGHAAQVRMIPHFRARRFLTSPSVHGNYLMLLTRTKLCQHDESLWWYL